MAQPIKFPSPGPTSTVETVTPGLAREWLGRNTRNRNLRRGLVATYAKDMVGGRWKYTGEAIKFAVDGTLLDGQHRLQAIAQADVAVPLLVVRGLDPAAQDAMDTGSKRTTADALTLGGEKNSKLLAAAAALILTDVGRGDRTVSTGEVSDLLKTEPFLRTICAEIVLRLRITGATPTVVAYAYWRLDKVSPDATATFFEALSTLAGLPATSPILALHRRLSDRGPAHARARTYRQETVALIFTAWNAWARREPRTLIKLGYSTDRRLSIPEPVTPQWLRNDG